jgi:hypothetical protein
VRDVVLALPLDQVHHRDALRGSEVMNGLLEPGRHRRQRRRRGERQSQLGVHVTHQRPRMLQRRHVQVQQQPADRLDLEQHVLSYDITDSPR